MEVWLWHSHFHIQIKSQGTSSAWLRTEDLLLPDLPTSIQGRSISFHHGKPLEQQKRLSPQDLVTRTEVSAVFFQMLPPSSKTENTRSKWMAVSVAQNVHSPGREYFAPWPPHQRIAPPTVGNADRQSFAHGARIALKLVWYHVSLGGADQNRARLTTELEFILV